MKATFKSYPSNLTTAQWALISPYIPDAKPGGRPRSTDIFLVVQAIVYVLCSGCSWRMLPGNFPQWQTVLSLLQTMAYQWAMATAKSYTPRATALESETT